MAVIAVMIIPLPADAETWKEIHVVGVEVQGTTPPQWHLIHEVSVSSMKQPDLYIWDGGGSDNLASNPLNWDSDAIPTEGQRVQFDATSTKDCTWDLSTEIYSLQLLTGYTGTLTQGNVNIAIGEGGYRQLQGTFIGNPDKSVYCAGHYIPGQITVNSVNLVMNGAGNITTTANFLRSLTVSADVTIPEDSTVRARQIFIDSTATVDNRGTLIQTIQATIPYLFDNQGAISGSGIFWLYPNTQDITLVTGNISCDVLMSMSSVASAHHTVTLGASSQMSSLEIRSDHSTYSLTLDLGGYSITADGITVATRGAIDGSGTIVNHGDYNVATGTMNGTMVSYEQAGPGLITVPNGTTFRHLTISDDGVLILASNLTVTGSYVNTGKVIPGQYRIFLIETIPEGYELIHKVEAGIESVVMEMASFNAVIMLGIIFIPTLMLAFIMGRMGLIIGLSAMSAVAIILWPGYIGPAIVNWLACAVVLWRG